MAGGDARKRRRVMLLETERALSELVEIPCSELSATVGTKHVPVEAVQENDDSVLWPRQSVGSFGHQLSSLAFAHMRMLLQVLAHVQQCCHAFAHGGTQLLCRASADVARGEDT